MQIKTRGILINKKAVEFTDKKGEQVKYTAYNFLDLGSNEIIDFNVKKTDLLIPPQFFSNFLEQKLVFVELTFDLTETTFQGKTNMKKTFVGISLYK